MKVKLPTYISKAPSELHTNSTGHTNYESESPFSIQMDKILKQENSDADQQKKNPITVVKQSESQDKSNLNLESEVRSRDQDTEIQRKSSGMEKQHSEPLMNSSKSEVVEKQNKSNDIIVAARIDAPTNMDLDEYSIESYPVRQDGRCETGSINDGMPANKAESQKSTSETGSDKNNTSTGFHAGSDADTIIGNNLRFGSKPQLQDGDNTKSFLGTGAKNENSTVLKADYPMHTHRDNPGNNSSVSRAESVKEENSMIDPLLTSNGPRQSLNETWKGIQESIKTSAASEDMNMNRKSEISTSGSAEITGLHSDTKENGQTALPGVEQKSISANESQIAKAFRKESDATVAARVNELVENNHGTRTSSEGKEFSNEGDRPDGRPYDSHAIKEVSGSLSSSLAEKTSTTPKTVQSETSPSVSSGTSGITGSGGAQTAGQAKPITAHFNELMPQVAERMQFLLRNGGGVIRVRLQPDEFGHMEIRAEATPKGVVARIMAESNIIKGTLENNLLLLQQNLQEQGLKVDRIQVLLQEGFDSQSPSEHSSRSGNPNSGQNEKNSNRQFTDTKQNEENGTDKAEAQSYRYNSRFYTVA